MKMPSVIATIMLVMVLNPVSLPAEEIQKTRDRPDGVSDYGSFAVVQKPVEGVGYFIDLSVRTIGKVSSFIVTLPFRPFMKDKKETGATHG